VLSESQHLPGSTRSIAAVDGKRFILSDWPGTASILFLLPNSHQFFSVNWLWKLCFLVKWSDPRYVCLLATTIDASISWTLPAQFTTTQNVSLLLLSGCESLKRFQGERSTVFKTPTIYPIHPFLKNTKIVNLSWIRNSYFLFITRENTGCSILSRILPARSTYKKTKTIMM
jgi:hypothetical protein